MDIVKIDARQVLEREAPVDAMHRQETLCSSCHNRMDPLGLALDNFNALGMWREQEHGQAIDASGTLLTGESFTSVKELKQILASRHAVETTAAGRTVGAGFCPGRGPRHESPA
jgi:hypothetical protein